MSNEAHIYSPVPRALQYEDKDYEVRVVSPHKPRHKNKARYDIFFTISFGPRCLKCTHRTPLIDPILALNFVIIVVFNATQCKPASRVNGMPRGS